MMPPPSFNLPGRHEAEHQPSQPDRQRFALSDPVLDRASTGPDCRERTSKPPLGNLKGGRGGV